jgi:glycosyltransferase 2 family protein
VAGSRPNVQPSCRPAGEKHSPRSWWLRVLTYLVAAGALAYVLLHVHLSDLAAGISNVTWWAVVLAVILHNAPRIPQAFRWAYLLRPAKIRPVVLLHALFVGILASGILPVCPNELVRGLVAARRCGISLARVLTSLVVERTADGLALALLAWLTVRKLNVPAVLDQALLALVVLLATATLVGLALTLEQAKLQAYLAPRQPQGRAGKFVKRVSLEVLVGAKAARGWTMPICVSTGGVMLFAQVASMWLMLHAYHLHLSLMQAAAIYGIVTVGTLVPMAPASIGSWQFFCVLGLSLFGVTGGVAASFSLVAFAVFTIPALLGGVIALVVSPVSWAGVTRRANEPAEAGGQEIASNVPGRAHEPLVPEPLLLLLPLPPAVKDPVG